MSNNPTAAQRRMWNEVVKVGCMACLEDGYHTAPEIHHVLKHGYRDHNLVFGLCPVHHKHTSSVPGIPNRHATPKRFIQKYGTDMELYERCQEIMEVKI